MMDDLAEDYPEAAEYITNAVNQHGEVWVLENFYTDLYPLAQLMTFPKKVDLPFFDPDEHDAPTDEEIQEMFRLRREYIENLKAASRDDES